MLCLSYLDALDTANLSSLKKRRTQLCCKYIRKMSQNDHSINFLIPKTATSDHSYNMRPGDNNGNIVYADRSCCRTQCSGFFISFSSKYEDMYIYRKRKNYTFIPTSLFRDYSLFRGFLYIYLFHESHIFFCYSTSFI